MKPGKAGVIIIAVLLTAALFAWAGSHGGIRVAGLPLFAGCVILAFLIQWMAFLPAWLGHTERYFDLVGSSTYIIVVLLALLIGGARDPRAVLLTILVCLWAVRLGTFLYIRVHQQGGDGRFDTIKHSFSRFFITWSLQGLWVVITTAAALAAITSTTPAPMGLLGLLGLGLWFSGFMLEAISDQQKLRFRSRAENRDTFIRHGLWAWSRHPNYFGEILLWCGIALIAFPALQGWQYLTLFSPVFVFLLLTRISGIPLLEARAKKRWGDDPAYRQWKNRTSRLIPRPPPKD